MGIIGSVVTVPAINGWYKTINKPAFIPPNWVFGPVWVLLFLLMGISAWLVWKRKGNLEKKKLPMLVFGIQLGLNLLWSILFFGWQAPIWSLVEIILLWLAILMTIKVFEPLSKAAAYLLIPYILWVSIAAILNLSIVILNF